MKRTLFERYGGFAVVSQIVMSFYDKILDSPTTRSFFANTDMKRLIDHQTKFIASVMGGPASYTDEQLERIHSPLGISEEAFRETLLLLEETLEEFNVETEDVQQIADEIMHRKYFIIAKT